MATSQPNAAAPIDANRRTFLTRAGAIGAAAMGAGVFGLGQRNASAVQSGTFKAIGGKSVHLNDAEILNFALNLEYLEAEFYLRATTGSGLADSEVTGVGSPGSASKPKSATPGAVTGGTAVDFQVPFIKSYALEIARHEHAHVTFLREALGKAAVARPAIDFTNAFTAAAIAAGVISSGETFDPFASDDNFLLGAFVFEDVGVTAYHGAAPFISKSAYLAAAAGILGTEAYHAGLVRTTLYARGQSNPFLIDAADKISALRAAAGGGADEGIQSSPGVSNIVPVDNNAITFARTFQEVLAIVYLGGTTKGGFFPEGTNGSIY